MLTAIIAVFLLINSKKKLKNIKYIYKYTYELREA